MSFFKLETTDTNSRARAGIISTAHGEIQTPVFMPVGTLGTVKAVEQRVLEELNAKIILGNTYHLYLRPGLEVIEKFGGLHKFINWKGAILTDSGGYQIFSLQDLRKISEHGAEFKSHIDGSKHFFSPEKVIDIQRCLGSDIVMVLDECVPYPTTYQYASQSMDLSLRWAGSCLAAFKNTEPRYGHNQYLFAIGQGSMFPDLRIKYNQEMAEMDFDGYALGGLSVGEPAEEMYKIIDISINYLPENKPRYLMGVGTPENILNAIELGIDMFDCVLPTRNARNGQLFTSNGKINIKNAKYKFSEKSIDETIESYASSNFSLAYLRHLFISDEILGSIIASQHNIAFYLWLVRTAREKILSGDFRQWKDSLLYKLNNDIN
ncbi:MAG: tRNA guanosine(34) transglycosylase Tgt [Candidatus Kapabacteria bacterium]|nr:tRNA guanosine(34) transglycosylase Tgt [Candidatus Kapabacteria bacterium]